MGEFALDLMPGLRKGTGGTPKDGGCVIQVASYLWNREWSDATPCVHAVLRSAAIRVNDTVDDQTRQKLYPLIPRLMGTAIEDEAENKRVSVGLAIWCAEQVFELVKPERKVKARAAIDAAKAWFVCPCEKHRASSASASAAAAAATYAAAAAAATYAAAAAAATYATYASASATAATYATATHRLQMLIGLLDEYDRLTGRFESYPVDVTEWESVKAMMADA